MRTKPAPILTLSRFSIEFSLSATLHLNPVGINETYLTRTIKNLTQERERERSWFKMFFTFLLISS